MSPSQVRILWFWNVRHRNWKCVNIWHLFMKIIIIFYTNCYQVLTPIWRNRQRNAFSNFWIPVPNSGVRNFKSGPRTQNYTANPFFLEFSNFSLKIGSQTNNLERRPNFETYAFGIGDGDKICENSNFNVTIFTGKSNY